jgi:chromosome segregation ATPase
MEAIEAQMNDLQKELQKCETDIARVQETLQDAQKKISTANQRRSELAARMAALKSEADEMKASRAAIAKERKAAEGEINEAKKLIGETAGQIEKVIPNDRPKAVEDAVKTVDDEIAAKKQSADELSMKLSVAEKAATDAQVELSGQEKATTECKTTINNLAGQIRMAQGRVATLNTAIKSTKNATPNEVLYLIGQLRHATDELEKLLDPKQEEKLVSQQLECQQRARVARADLAKKVAERDQLRQNLAAAEKDSKSSMTWRETAIKNKLSTLAEDYPQRGSEGAAAPASTEAERSH